VQVFDGAKSIWYTCNSDEDIIGLIEDKLTETTGDKSKPIKDILWELGIGDQEELNTAQIMDKRSKALIEQYQYFSANVSVPYGSDPFFIWFESCLIMKKVFEVKGL